MKTKAIIFVLFCTSFSFGQTFLERQAEKTKEKIKQRAENRVDQGIDKTLDKTEGEIESTVKGEQKEKNKNTSSSEGISNQERSEPSNDNPTSVGEAASGSFDIYAKYDFVAGEKTMAFEDFSQDAVGDFPAKWNTDSGGEIVSIETGNHWFNFTSSGMVFPEFIDELPENFTLEMDLVFSEDFANMQRGLMLLFPESKHRNLSFDMFYPEGALVGTEIHPYGNEGGNTSVWIRDQSSSEVMSNNKGIENWKAGKVNHLSIWRQKERLKVYINEQKAWDLPRAFLSDVNYSFVFGTYVWNGKIYMTNLRLAEGLPDTRNKLLTEGKVISRGILFDINSAKIKPESYGALKEIAKTLNELPEVKVKIVGHTDADGDDKMNLELSKKRSIAVKEALVKEFNINADRIETDGKGETEPVDINTTPTGKANNRRVEFVKL